MYKRGHLLTTRAHVQLEVASTATAAADWVIWYWVSSNLDQNNPLLRLSADIGVAAPWQADESDRTSARTILDSSRRVVKRYMRAIGTGQKGRSLITFDCVLPVLRDRIGNRVIGGQHVRNVTNAPGGAAGATDVLVADLLTDEHGVRNALNIVAAPSRPGTGTAHNISGTKVVLYQTFELFDRVLS